MAQHGRIVEGDSAPARAAKRFQGGGRLRLPCGFQPIRARSVPWLPACARISTLQSAYSILPLLMLVQDPT